MAQQRGKRLVNNINILQIFQKPYITNKKNKSNIKYYKSPDKQKYRDFFFFFWVE